MQQFAEIMNKSTKASISFDLVMRGCLFYEMVLVLLYVLIGLVLGIALSTKGNSGLYGVLATYFITII